jgi:hypothetical protein
MAAASKSSDDELASSLAARCRQLESEMAGIEAAAVSATAGGIGFGKRIGEGTNIAVERISEVAIHDRLLAELATVRRAEEKLSDGTTGHCDECGEVIPAERLEVLPWAVRCVNCAAQGAR